MSLFTPTRVLAAGVVLTGLALALPIDAQVADANRPAPPPAMQGHMRGNMQGPQHGPGQGHGPMMHAGMRGRGAPWDHVEGRLAYAKAEIGIKPDQEANWNKVAEVLRQHAAAQRQFFEQRRQAHEQAMTQLQAQRQANPNAAPAPRPQLSAIDQLTRRKDMMERASAFTTDLINAAKPLYAQLDDQQKAVADRLMRRPA